MTVVWITFEFVCFKWPPPEPPPFEFTLEFGILLYFVVDYIWIYRFIHNIHDVSKGRIEDKMFIVREVINGELRTGTWN